MTYEFRLILSGVEEITPELADRLYQATAGDIEFSMRNGVAWLDFYRDADSLEQAIRRAIDEVHGCAPDCRVARVETEESALVSGINQQLQVVGS